MSSQTLTRPTPLRHLPSSLRPKTTSTQYVAARFRDPTFEKLMKSYKNLLKVVSVQDLILAAPRHRALPLDLLARLAQRLRLNRGALPFLRKYPHVFSLFYTRSNLQPFCTLTHTALAVCREEAAAIHSSRAAVVERLVRLLTISESKSLPLRGIFKVWRELGLPDDFEKSVILRNPDIFTLCDAHEPKTHILKLVPRNLGPKESTFSSSVEDWRRKELTREDSKYYDELEIRYAFKHGFPSGMKLSKVYRAKVKEWQSLPYVGPYDELREKKKTRAGVKALEKRAVAIVHEFLSLTVEKMVEVEKISHFRKWFGIELNIRDLFLDHPGIFYLSTKGKGHMVFLREAYERGCLVEPNPVYVVRRKLFELVLLGRRGLFMDDAGEKRIVGRDESSSEEDDD